MIKDGHYTNAIEGWISDEELNWLYQTSRRMTTIVEIGSYRGRSTTALCEGCHDGTVTAVDIFRDEDLPIFMANVGHLKNLNTLREPSVSAATKFNDRSVDMVFIDGDHSYESCRDDIAAWLPKCKTLICGHDMYDDGLGHWPGVIKAVTEAFPEGIELVGSIWFKPCH